MAQAARKHSFEILTEAADRLLRAGAFDIYSETRVSGFPKTSRSPWLSSTPLSEPF